MNKNKNREYKTKEKTQSPRENHLLKQKSRNTIDVTSVRFVQLNATAAAATTTAAAATVVSPKRHKRGERCQLGAAATC